MTKLANKSVIACPHCRHQAVKSGGATFFRTSDITRWSDGYVESWFGRPFFTRCRACRGVYWVEDAPVIPNSPLDDEEPQEGRPGWLQRLFGRKNPPMDVTHLSNQLFGPQPINTPDIDAIAIGVEMAASGPAEREQQIRRLLWWSFNTPYRRARSIVPSISRAIRLAHEDKNLNRLLELSYKDGRPAMETVEILREQGRFDEAQTALGQLSPESEGYDVIARKIAERDTTVCVLRAAEWDQSSGVSRL